MQGPPVSLRKRNPLDVVQMGSEGLSRQSSQSSSEGQVRYLMSCSGRDSLGLKKVRQESSLLAVATE